MDNHPAFMSEFDPSKPMSPELEALVNLKYEGTDDMIGKRCTKFFNFRSVSLFHGDE